MRSCWAVTHCLVTCYKVSYSVPVFQRMVKICKCIIVMHYNFLLLERAAGKIFMSTGSWICRYILYIIHILYINIYIYNYMIYWKVCQGMYVYMDVLFMTTTTHTNICVWGNFEFLFTFIYIYIYILYIWIHFYVWSFIHANTVIYLDFLMEKRDSNI